MRWPLRYFWCFVTPLFFARAHHLLWRWGAPYNDGYGMTARSFYTVEDEVTSISWKEYPKNWKIRLRYRLPFLLAAATLTALCCGVAGRILSSKARQYSSRFFAAAAGAALLIALLVAIVDSGTHFGVWRQATVYGGLDSTIFMVRNVIAPLAAMTGVFSVAELYLQRSAARSIKLEQPLDN